LGGNLRVPGLTTIKLQYEGLTTYSMTKQQGNNLIKILCSSLWISHSINKELSVPDLAVDYKKLRGSFHQEMDEALREFDETSMKEVEESPFKPRLSNIDNKISKLSDQFRTNAPKPIKRESPSKGESKYVEIHDINVEEHPIIKKWFKKFTFMGGNHCYQFESDDLNTPKRKLSKIASYQIKYDAMQQVEDEASLNGQYHFQKEFQKVPDACKYFRKKLGDQYTRDLLKEKIKNRALIYENGDILEDWSTINRRINAWLHHEKNKYN